MPEILQQIIKCPVCHRTIKSDLASCEVCEDLSFEKTDDSSDSLTSLLDLDEQGQEFEDQQSEPFTTELFANSFFPWVYEEILPVFWSLGLRGWGGIEKEALEVIKFFGRDPKIVMDLSCGTGIMSRKLAQSRFYELIIALDYSKAMLEMLISKAEKTSDIAVIRGNAESIPLISDSLDAVYAGAAIHCWKNPKQGVAEIYRVLCPGGKIFATTFAQLVPGQKKYCFSIDELKSLFQQAGFKQELLDIELEGIYFTIKGTK